jgi:riboflavin synthase
MRIGIADTTFARINMADIAIASIKNKDANVDLERYTVPGFKDLPVACKRLFTDYKCDIIIALGWVGKEDIDEVCASEANMGLINVEIEANKHILKVFFHEKEAAQDVDLQKKIAIGRVEKHALNALELLKGKEALTPRAGQGLRQGYNDAGVLK